MVLAAAGFGLITIDLYRVVAANLDFIQADVWFAIKAGALWQFFGLLLKMSIAMLCYLILKFCEHVLVIYVSEHCLVKRK